MDPHPFLSVFGCCESEAYAARVLVLLDCPLDLVAESVPSLSMWDQSLVEAGVVLVENVVGGVGVILPGPDDAPNNISSLSTQRTIQHMYRVRQQVIH